MSARMAYLRDVDFFGERPPKQKRKRKRKKKVIDDERSFPEYRQMALSDDFIVAEMDLQESPVEGLSKSGLSRFRAQFLKYNCATLLDGRRGDEERRDILEWILSDRVHPFSFVTCVAEEGASPAEFRKMVLDTVKRMGCIPKQIQDEDQLDMFSSEN